MQVESPFPDERCALHFERPSPYPFRLRSAYETAVLLQSIEAGTAAAVELATGQLDEARRLERRRLAQRGMRAKDDLAIAYLPDAEWYARCRRRDSRGHDGEDLMQEALIGLLRSIATFDPESRCPFESHAAHSMQFAVRRAIAGPWPRSDPEDGDSAAA